MDDTEQTKEKLFDEIRQVRQQVAELQAAKIERNLAQITLNLW